MAHLIETIAAIVGTFLFLGGSYAVKEDGRPRGCVVALVGIALVLALGLTPNGLPVRLKASRRGRRNGAPGAGDG
jgi:hypothetical protein